MSSEKFDNASLYVYGIIPVKELAERNLQHLEGIDHHPISIKIHQEIAAVITPVNPHKFSQKNIDLLSKNLEWLEENAFHHHSCIEEVNKEFTILPLSFCTVFQSETRLVTNLDENYQQILAKLESIKDMNEWNLKVYCQRDIMKQYVSSNNDEISKFKNTLQSMPTGKQFLMKKKLDQKMEEEFIFEQGRWQSHILQSLLLISKETCIRKNWGRELTSRKDEMVLNCDFLVGVANSEEFLITMTDLEKSYILKGCTFEVTGPWPPYHFSGIDKG